MGGNNTCQLFVYYVNPLINVVGLCVCFLSICWLGCNLFEEVEGLLTLLECLVFQMVQVN
jgi:hypothetical protein